MTTAIIIACAIVLAALIAAAYLFIAALRKKNELDAIAQELSEKASALQKRENSLDLWEKQLNTSAEKLHPAILCEKATISAEKNLTKKKARKLLASKFGYDIIDFIKIFEKQNEDGSVTYSGKFKIFYEK